MKRKWFGFLIVAGMSVSVACGDGATEPAPAPNRAPLASGSISPQTVAAGETATVNVASYFTDPDGDALTFTATSSNAATASVAMSGGVVTVTAAARGVATVTVTASDSGGLSAQLSFTVTVPNQAPVAVDAVPAQTIFVGDSASVDMAAYFSDPDADALSYSAESSDATAVSASVSGSVVSLSAITLGMSTVTVTARDPDGLAAEQDIAVAVPNREPVAVGTIPEQALEPGQTTRLDMASYFTDPDGDALSYTAASSNGGVATVTVDGSALTVAGAAAGMATITVTARDPGGLAAQQGFSVTVQAGTQAGLAISGIEPTVLVEGQTARITGSGFSATGAQNQVSVGGRNARVTAATPTSLTIVVPAAHCLPPRREELRVAVGGESDARTVGVTPRSLEVEPNHYWYSDGGNGCLHLAGNASGGEYLFGVVSTSEDPASLTAVTLTGTPWDASAVGAEAGRIVVAADTEAFEEAGQGAMAALAHGPFRPSAGFDREPVFPVAAASAGGDLVEWPLADDTLRMRRARAHNEIMARNVALLRRLGRATRPALADARRNLQAGDSLTLYVDSDGTCSSAGQVRAVVRMVGNRSTWLDDVDNPAATFTDAELANLDAFYSTNIKGVHDDYFGGLSDVDGNGRFLVLMTKEVNRAGVGGWVSPGDLYSSSACATSNQAEIFYGKVPDPQGTVGDVVARPTLFDDYPALVAHEVTHLVQSNAHVYANAADGGWKTSWEWEGGAVLAEQLVAYRLFGHGSGQELGWAAYNHSAESRNWYWDWLADMAVFFGWDYRGDGTGRISGAPEECSWVGRPDEGNSGPCLDGREVYGVPSMVYRYAMDRWGGDYPGGERALMRRLTQSPAQGFASLVDVSPERSWRPEQILADFYMTLWLDLQGRATYGMSTWNLHDIFANWENARLQPYTSFSHAPRLTGRRVRAGSSLYFHWTPIGALRTTSIKVTSASGGRVPDHISVWALRVR